MNAARATLSPSRWLSAIALLVIGCAALLATAQFVRADLRAEIYKDRLDTLASEYQALTAAYNSAVKRTAVTELIVSQDNTLAVKVRDAAGKDTTIPTSLDPSTEIYVDFIVADSRLLIRRIFDEATPPSKGLLLDDTLKTLGWQEESANITFGKAVYRQLSPGRWVVSVSGDGSLGLEKLDLQTQDPPALTHAPAIGNFEQWLTSADTDAKSISIQDAIRAFFTP